jgi:hypothetical protein
MPPTCPKQRSTAVSNGQQPPGRRCVKPSSGTGSACRPATPTPSANAPSTPFANAAASRPPRPWTRCLWRSTLVSSPARERSPAELYQWVRREEQYATLGANVVVELYSESHGPPANHPRLGDHPTGRPQPPAGRPTHQPPRPPPRRPSRPHQPVPSSPGAGDGGPMPADSTGPTSGQRFHACCLC